MSGLPHAVRSRAVRPRSCPRTAGRVASSSAPGLVRHDGALYGGTGPGRVGGRDGGRHAARRPVVLHPVREPAVPRRHRRPGRSSAWRWASAPPSCSCGPRANDQTAFVAIGSTGHRRRRRAHRAVRRRCRRSARPRRRRRGCSHMPVEPERRQLDASTSRCATRRCSATTDPRSRSGRDAATAAPSRRRCSPSSPTWCRSPSPGRPGRWAPGRASTTACGSTAASPTPSGCSSSSSASWPTAGSATARCGCGRRTGKLIATGSQTASMRYLFDEGQMPNLPAAPDVGSPGPATNGARAVLDPELFLPEPEPREVHATIISVDDHLVEPPGMFEGRLPAHLQDRAPQDRRERAGATRCGSSTASSTRQVGHERGRRAAGPETVKVEPFRFDQMRPGLLRRRRPRRTTWTSTACGRRSASRR